MLPFKRPQNTDEKTEMVYQILSWDAFDEDIEQDYSGDDEPDPSVVDKRYHIYTFGVNELGESVCVRFEDYRPYLFALIPENYQKSFTDFYKYISSDIITYFSRDKCSNWKIFN